MSNNGVLNPEKTTTTSSKKPSFLEKHGPVLSRVFRGGLYLVGFIVSGYVTYRLDLPLWTILVWFLVFMYIAFIISKPPLLLPLVYIFGGLFVAGYMSYYLPIFWALLTWYILLPYLCHVVFHLKEMTVKKITEGLAEAVLVPVYGLGSFLLFLAAIGPSKVSADIFTFARENKLLLLIFAVSIWAFPLMDETGR
jgi:hypothetical protein